MEVGLVHKIDIDQEMQQSYLDYAMSVIVARALPDARDGLKPVHRRILYAMYDMGIRPDSPYKKSARIVGEVLGKYHPHGDMTVYEAMARMAQDFSMRCPLVDGQGNFGSVDGDPPAAMRYTEARLTSAAMSMLTDINKDTVDFDPNFDDTLKEPRVLPAAIPNLLVNGASGIAVGMSTSIPPHNLGEIVEALKYLLENWEKIEDINLEDLMRYIQGPDFPTGGVIIHTSEEDALGSAYGTGRGRVTVQASAHLEEMERGRNRIIVTELPYLVNKSSLIERIAELAREERVSGIADLRDESDRQGMRIVIELTKTADPQAVLRDLYKHTPMQSTFSIIMLALVEGEPRLLTLKQALRVFLDHRLEVVRRRSEHDLAKARQRAHILEGLLVALKNLDEVIALIRKAPDADTARVRLEKRFKLTQVQAQAILDMQLRRLASLERKKIEQEYQEVQALIKSLEGLLRSPKKMRQVVAEELQIIKDTFGDRRRTRIVSLKAGVASAPLTSTDLAPDQSVWLYVSPEGSISRFSDEKTPRQSGNEAPGWLLKTNTRDTLYLVCQDGKAAALPVQTVPETEKPALGAHFARISALQESDQLAGLFTLPPKAERAEDWFILSCTKQGMVKKSPLSDLPGPSANSFTLARVNNGDRLGWLRLTDGKADILLMTARGFAIRFNEAEVRPMGLVAAGVSGIKLQPGDEVVGMELPGRGKEVFMIASDGSAKRVAIEQFPLQGRYGQGVVAWKLPAKVNVVGIAVGKETLRITLRLDKLAPKMVRLDAAPLQGRAARGKIIQDLKPGDHVIGLTAPWEVERASNQPQSSRAAGATGSKPQPSKIEAKKKQSTRKTAPLPKAPSSSTVDKAKPSRTTRMKSTPDKPAPQVTAPSRTKKQKTTSTGTKTKPVSPKAEAPKASTTKTSSSESTNATTEKKPAARKQSAPKPLAKKNPTSKSPSGKKPGEIQPDNKTGKRSKTK